MKDGDPILTPVTQIGVGDKIYNYDIGEWVSVTRIVLAEGGHHEMYDLYSYPEGPHVSANGPIILEYIANGYPDCPCVK